MKNRPSLLDIEAFNQQREPELEQETSMLEEDSDKSGSRDPRESESEIIQMIKTQKNEIDRISNELIRVVGQLKAHKNILEKQDKEIAFLKTELDRRTSRGEENQETREADQIHNKKLILNNIVMLIEEKGFSYNDVARLFKLEGFLPPSPYSNWDEEVVEELYAIAR